MIFLLSYKAARLYKVVGTSPIRHTTLKFEKTGGETVHVHTPLKAEKHMRGYFSTVTGGREYGKTCPKIRDLKRGRVRLCVHVCVIPPAVTYTDHRPAETERSGESWGEKPKEGKSPVHIFMCPPPVRTRTRVSAVPLTFQLTRCILLADDNT